MNTMMSILGFRRSSFDKTGRCPAGTLCRVLKIAALLCILFTVFLSVPVNVEAKCDPSGACGLMIFGACYGCSSEAECVDFFGNSGACHSLGGGFVGCDNSASLCYFGAPEPCPDGGDGDPCCGDICCGNPLCGNPQPLFSLYTPENILPQTCDGYAAEPIALVSGTESFERTDLTIGKLYPIVIDRRYNSRSAYDSPLGYGWALNYFQRLYTYPDGSVTLRKECGVKKRPRWDAGSAAYVTTIPQDAQLTFTRTDYCWDIYDEVLNTWLHACHMSTVDTPQDKSSALAQNADGTYTITDKFGGKEEYDAQGRLVSKRAPNGNSLAFTYESVIWDPIFGLLRANIDQNTPLIVAYDYRLKKIEEKNASGQPTGAWVEFHYNSGSGWLSSITDSATRTVNYDHDPIGNLVSVSGPGGNAIYGYNSSSNKHLLTNIDEGQGEYVNTYDTRGRAIKQTHAGGETDITYTTPYINTAAKTIISDPSGATLHEQTRNVSFGKLGLVSQAIDADGNWKTYSRDGHGWITEEARYDSNNALLSRTTYSYDHWYDCTDISGYVSQCHNAGPEKGNLLAKIEAVGTAAERTTTYTYHPAFGKVLTETVQSVVNPALASIVTNSYDSANGNLLSRDESGYLGDVTLYAYTTVYTYDANGKLTGIDGPRPGDADKIIFAYNLTTGYLASMTQPIIGTTTFADHDSLGNPQTVTDPNGNSSNYTYDGTGRVLTVKAPGDTNPTQYFYISGGCTSCGGEENKIDHIILPEGNRIDYAYDTLGNLRVIKDSLNNTISYTYDSEGNKLTEQIKDSGEALQKSLSYQYDALNRVAVIMNPDSSYTQYTYDGLGNRKTAKDPKGNTTTYNYDALSRLIAVIQPGNVTTTYEYNLNSNLTKVTDSNNSATVYRYDDKGRVYLVISPDTGTTTYAYDPAGNLTSKTDAKGITLSYTYDAANRLTGITAPAVDGFAAFSISYTYDVCTNGKGRLCSMDDASGTTSYEYSPKGQVTKETKLISSHTYITQYTYDQNGNMKTMTYPSGKVITYNYTNDRATSIVLNNAVNLATNIAYKPFGGMTSIIYGNGITSSIGYDNQYHLSTLVTSTFQNLTYGYDYNGNITSITPGKTYTYDTLDRLGTATGTWGSLGWTYDGVGNRQTENANTYTYAPYTNKLATANGISFGYDNNGNTTTQSSRVYTYNQNQRLIQVVDGAMTAGYTYNGNGQRVKKTVNSVTTVFHYSLNGQIIAESNSSGTIIAEYVYLNGQPLAKMEGANTYYYHNDHLATPQKMTDSTGTIVWAADYKPFGEATITVSTITNNLRFPGQYYDAETGLHYNYFRDYNPLTGRYIEKDRLGLRGGINLYRYSRNNPLRYTDPWGLWTSATEYGTTLGSLQSDMTSIAGTVDGAFQQAVHHDAVVTFTTNGTHSDHSLHYYGEAVDLRTRDMTDAQIESLANNLANLLSDDYQVILELDDNDHADHIHVEYNPPGNRNRGSCPR